MVSPEALPSPGGGVGVRKPAFKPSKEDAHGAENGRIPTTGTSGEDGSLEGSGGSTMTASYSRSPSSKTQYDKLHPNVHSSSHQQVHSNKPSNDETVGHHSTIPVYTRNSGAIGGGANGVGTDVLLQWGQRKRSRCTRQAEKMLSNSKMPPPPPLAPRLASTANGRARVKLTANAMLYGKEASGSGFVSGRNNRMIRTMERSDKRVSCNYGSSSRKGKCEDQSSHVEESRGGGGSEMASGEGEKGNNGGGGEVFEWPRIYIALSRKEKEDDFYAMKGTKLPHRPKKRSKAIDRTLQYCFPGLWLSDLTRARYEVRERKSKKQKRRGLRGLESIDSDSE